MLQSNYRINQKKRKKMEKNNLELLNNINTVEADPVIPSTTTSGTSFTIGHAGTIGAANGIVNNSSLNTFWPYYYPYYHYQTPAWVTINKAENGFILVKEGKTYICKKAEDIVKLLEEPKEKK